MKNRIWTYVRFIKLQQGFSTWRGTKKFEATIFVSDFQVEKFVIDQTVYLEVLSIIYS